MAIPLSKAEIKKVAVQQVNLGHSPDFADSEQGDNFFKAVKLQFELYERRIAILEARTGKLSLTAVGSHLSLFPAGESVFASVTGQLTSLAGSVGEHFQVTSNLIDYTGGLKLGKGLRLSSWMDTTAGNLQYTSGQFKVYDTAWNNIVHYKNGADRLLTFEASLSSLQAFSSGSPALVQFASNTDTHLVYDPFYYEVTLTEPGTYAFNIQVEIAANVSGPSNYHLSLLFNNVEVLKSVNKTAENTTLAMSKNFYISGSTVVKVEFTTVDQAADLVGSYSTFFQINRLV